MTPFEELRKRLDELGVEYDTFDPISTQNTYWNVGELRYRYCGRKDSMTELTMFAKCGLTPEQVISATVGKGKAKAHPWGYESDTGFFDMTRCECGETNDISARYCNQCGREIQLDMSVIEYAEDYTPQRTCKVNADGTLTSLRDGKTYVDAATVGGTCRLVDNESGPDMHCTVCGREVDDEYRYFMERWGYSRCPHCGRRIEVDE